MSVLTLLLALFAWLLGPFAPLVPFAQVGIVAVAGAFVVYETVATSVARPIEASAPPGAVGDCPDEPPNSRGLRQEHWDADGVRIEIDLGRSADPALKDRAET